MLQIASAKDFTFTLFRPGPLIARYYFHHLISIQLIIFKGIIIAWNAVKRLDSVGTVRLVVLYHGLYGCAFLDVLMLAI